jgi:hypothetical protein
MRYDEHWLKLIKRVQSSIYAIRHAVDAVPDVVDRNILKRQLETLVASFRQHLDTGSHVEAFNTGSKIIDIHRLAQKLCDESS